MGTSDLGRALVLNDPPARGVGSVMAYAAAAAAAFVVAALAVVLRRRRRTAAELLDDAQDLSRGAGERAALLGPRSRPGRAR